MSPKHRRVDRLLLAAEAASGAMRSAAWELEQIADALPSRGNIARKQQLELCSARILAAANALTAEVNAKDGWSAKWAVRIARAGLAAGAALAIGGITGVGEGATSNLVDHYLKHEFKAKECLDEVDTAADEIIRHAESVDVVDSLNTFSEKVVRFGSWLINETRDYSSAGPEHTRRRVDAIDGVIRSIDGTENLGLSPYQRFVVLDAALGSLGSFLTNQPGPVEHFASLVDSWRHLAGLREELEQAVIGDPQASD